MLPLSVLRHRDFKNLFYGQSISQLGDALYYVVFMFMVAKITGKAAMVGFVGAVEMLPFVLFSGYAGVLADRIDRRAILLWTDWLCMGVLLAFAAVIFATGTPPVWTIFATAFALSTLRAFFYPAKNAAIPNLVPPEDNLEANTLNAMSFNLFFALGLTLSALVLASLYKLSPTFFFGLTVLLNAASFGVSALFIRLLPVIRPERSDVEKRPWKEFKHGVAYIRKRRVLTVMMLAGLCMSLAVAPFFVTYVAANETWFGGHPHTLAGFELAFFIGMIVGSAVLAKMKFKRVGLGYAVGLGITGLMVVFMAGSPFVWLFALLNLFCGLVIPFADIPYQSYLQVKVEDAFRGRVNSALTMLRNGMMPAGMALAGWLIDAVGLVPMFLIIGFAMMAVAAVALLDREFRHSSLEDDPVLSSDPQDGELALGEAIA
jgi:MFS transporter, DHA3 family, macrolide efflux protein